MSKQKILIWSCVAVFLMGIAGSIVVLILPHGTQIEIMQNGTVLYTFNLTEAQDQVLEIEYDGRINTVQIENGRIRMLEAECPDKTCVHMGWLNAGSMPIVCLPNHLSIQFTDTEDMDALIR